MSYIIRWSLSDRELAGALLEASLPAWYVRSYHLHPSHLAGEDSIKEFSALLHPLAGQVLDDKRQAEIGVIMVIFVRMTHVNLLQSFKRDNFSDCFPAKIMKKSSDTPE